MKEFVEEIKKFLNNPSVELLDEKGLQFKLTDEKLIVVGGSFDNGKTFYAAVDNKKVFNKYSQCPIHLSEMPLSGRKEKRLREALEFLKTKEGREASATFSWTGWDEFSRI